MDTTYSKGLLRDSLTALQGLLALEGSVGRAVKVECDIDIVMLSEPAAEGVDVQKIETATQRIGMAWVERMEKVKRQRQRKARPVLYVGALREENGRQIEFDLYISPIEAVYYLEEAARRGWAGVVKNPSGAADRSISIPTFGGAGAIPIGAKLVMSGWRQLDMVGSGLLRGVHVHPLTVSLTKDGQEVIDMHRHVAEWVLAESYGEVLVLEPSEARDEPAKEV